jgi:UDP-N-acetylglucosamine:LPS N-acetylglucosamine transferase
MAHRALIVSASIGAGHDHIALELKRRLQAAGNEVAVVDFLDALPISLGRLLRWSYRQMLHHQPALYERIYQLWFAPGGRRAPSVSPVTLPATLGLARQLAGWRPDVAVATFHLASLALGRLRERGWLRCPAATYVTDFAVHRLWVHPAIDLHLCLHPGAGAEVRRAGGRASAPGPVVAPAFLDQQPDRGRARQALGLAAGDRVALVVVGAWGAGDPVPAVESLAAAGVVPVTVCGHRRQLQDRLRSLGRGVTLGWVEDMPRLMAAADVLVENAGGLTALEAAAARLPVVTYAPIPGHGRANAAGMAAAGVTVLARDAGALRDAVDRLTVPGPERARLVAAGLGLFTGDAAAEIIRLARSGSARHALGPARPSPIHGWSVEDQRRRADTTCQPAPGMDSSLTATDM